jgi:tetratricopeptide (TPR) repeat protein
MRTLATLTVLAAAVFAQADKMEQVKMRQRIMIERYGRHLDGMAKLDAATRAKTRTFLETGILGGEYGCIHQSLLEIYPEYKRADALLLGERFVAAAAAFETLRTSDDPYLKTYATYRLGLAEMNRERYEDAETAFRAVLNSDEMRKFAGCDTEAYFYRIICLGQMREKEQALAAIEAFEKDFPEAPERFKKAVEQVKNELMQEWESPLYDLAGRMNHVANEIGKGDTGAETQGKQKEIVSIIEELIKRQEEQEGQGQGQGKGNNGSPRGNQRSSNPANKSQAPPGASRNGDLRPKPDRKAGETWGEMRDKERDEVLQALKEKFPDRYRELLEQYNKALAEGKRVTAPADGE